MKPLFIQVGVTILLLGVMFVVSAQTNTTKEQATAQIIQGLQLVITGLIAFFLLKRR